MAVAAQPPGQGCMPSPASLRTAAGNAPGVLGLHSGSAWPRLLEPTSLGLLEDLPPKLPLFLFVSLLPFCTIVIHKCAFFSLILKSKRYP